jgi:hypothetical protein
MPFFDVPHPASTGRRHRYSTTLIYQSSGQGAFICIVDRRAVAQ